MRPLICCGCVLWLSSIAIYAQIQRPSSASQEPETIIPDGAGKTSFGGGLPLATPAYLPTAAGPIPAPKGNTGTVVGQPAAAVDRKPETSPATIEVVPVAPQVPVPTSQSGMTPSYQSGIVPAPSAVKLPKRK